MALPPVVLGLVERFDRNRDSYLAGGINETQLRREFIVPFLSSLGRDTENKQGHAPDYREVVFEDSLRVGGETFVRDPCPSSVNRRITDDGRRTTVFTGGKRESLDEAGRPLALVSLLPSIARTRT
jgi:hypothetical protein